MRVERCKEIGQAPGDKWVVFYTGIGANKTGRHSPGSFMRIMRKHFRDDRRAGFGLCEWVNWAGAELVTRETFKKITRKQNSQ